MSANSSQESQVCQIYLLLCIWPNNNIIMNLMETKKIEDKGYGAIAIENLDPGQELLCEEAAVVGPASAESCLECLQITRDQCSKCGFSLCSHCQNSQNTNICHRHDSTECEALQKLRQNHPADLSGLFNLVFPLRFLRLKCDDPKTYNRLITLESHLDLRTKQVIR